MLHIGHPAEHGEHAVGCACKSECPTGHAALRLTLFHLRHNRVRHIGQTTAKKGFHDNGRNAPLLQFAVKIDGIGVAVVDFVGILPVEVVELNLYKIPVVASFIVPFQEHIENRHIAVIREAKVADASSLLLFHQPVEDAVVHIASVERLFGILIFGTSTNCME